MFLSSSADIAIYGGAAGGGKTWSLLIEPLRHIRNGAFGAVVFRRTYPEITNQGGMWDESTKLYPLAGGTPLIGDLLWKFPSGMRVSFSHLQHEDSVVSWRGAQIPLIGFDQLETFTRQQFFYLLSRNRSTCGVKPYIRATCNPEPGWLAEFLDWWIADDGYANLDRMGKLRWMVMENDSIRWFDSREAAINQFQDALPKSVTFIAATVYDNQALLSKDPEYLANLKNLPLVDRERLLGDAVRGGNWKAKPSAGKVFNRAWFPIVQSVPPGGVVVRRWDFAATEKQLSKPDPDYTASCLMLSVNGSYYILDVTAEQLSPARVEALYESLTWQDAERFRWEKRRYMSRWEQEGGSAGKRESWRMTRKMAGVDAKGCPSVGDKLTRAKPFAVQAEIGNVFLLAGQWNEMFLDHMHGQPDLPHDDIMDAASGAFYDLTHVIRAGISFQG